MIAGQIQQQWTAHQRLDEPIQLKNVKLQTEITLHKLLALALV